MFKVTGLPLIFLTVLALPGAAMADKIHLEDGSIISGDITIMEETRLVIETAFAGALEISPSAIKGIETDRAKVTQMQSGDRVIGRLIYDDHTGQQISSNLLGPVAVNTADINGLWNPGQPSPVKARMEEMAAAHAEEIADLQDKAENTAKEVWSGRVNVGFSGSHGNNKEMNFTGKAMAKRETEFDRMKFSIQGHFENTEGEETKNEIKGEARVENDLSDHLFVFTNLGLERDKFEELDLRADLTAGLGYFIIKEDHHELKPRFGIGYEISAYENAPNEEELIFTTGYDYRIDMHVKMRFTHSFTYLPAIEDPGANYRLDSDAALAYPINDDDAWNLELGLRHQYDSMPTDSVDKLGTYYSLGIVREFD